ncbi:MAG: hypothetical protein ACOCZ9_04005 [Spirochaetota bacterium]
MKNAQPVLLLTRAARGYQRILTFSAGILGVMATAALISLAVVFPLWLTAIRHPQLYTAAVVGISAFAILFIIARAIRRNGVTPLLTALRRVVTVAGTVMAGYFILVLLATGRLFAGIPLALVFILLLGVIAGWNRTGHKGKRRDNDAPR